MGVTCLFYTVCVVFQLMVIVSWFLVEVSNFPLSGFIKVIVVVQMFPWRLL